MRSLRAGCIGGLSAAGVSRSLWVLAMCCGIVGGSGPRRSQAAERVDYLKEIKPLLAARCYACHGALQQKSGLRLDTAALLKKGGENGAAIVPGKSDESLLIEHVTAANGAPLMPPAAEGERLKPDEVAKLRRWIDDGAVAPVDEKPEKDPQDHWAFRRPIKPEIPAIRAGGGAPHPAAKLNPIDAFLSVEHARLGLTPQPAAEKPVLLRRVYLDLIGLPPTPEELAAFVADSDPAAYERVVDKLLASPHYGERWGRHWMDIWRYSDWWGLGADVRNSQKHMWHFRDWIIESLNADKGYDQMLREMLAADELYPNDLDKLRGTGFLVRHYFKFNRNTWLDETIEHTSKAFLGLTMNCARCHDHKYDPFSTQEYYRLRAIFEPYQVRTDFVPGELNVEKDGLPRVFDCHLDAPTYRYVRGDEKQPLKDRPMTPGLPAVLSFDELKITPVALPAEAHQPGLRPFVLQEHLRLAEQQIATARDGVTAARKQREMAEQAAAAARAAAEKAASETQGGDKPAGDQKQKSAKGNEDLDALLDKPVSETASNPRKKEGGTTAAAIAAATEIKPQLHDTFAAAKPAVWEMKSGEWVYAEGKLQQRAQGDQRGVLRLKPMPPQDFQVRLKFTITGGQRWKSVGVTFDVTEKTENLVYLSAVNGGSKLQVAHKQGANYVYPPDGLQNRTVKLNEPQELLLRVRGPLVNASVNGETVLVYQLPHARSQGAIEVITYDAQVTFESFELAPLPSTLVLAEVPSTKKTGKGGTAATGATPAAKSQPLTVEQAKLAVTLADKVLAAAEQQPAVLQARFAAEKAKYATPPVENAQSLASEAARSEKQAALLKAEEAVAQNEYDLSRAEAAKRGEVEKKLTAARDALVKAREAAVNPGTAYTPLRGALKTPESNVETEASRMAPFPATSSGRRTALAQWLTDRRHPLTARVAVNHIWSRHFGRPLVATVFEFGRKGAEPSHPALLDFLVVELQEHAWSMKSVHRLLVTSQAYRRSSSSLGATAATVAADPENRWYWRMNPVRMEAQTVRDSLLHLAGDLDLKLGGPSIHPVNEAMSRRRSLYFIHSHNDHHKFLSLFDDANVLECYRRTESIVPQQALALTNSEFALQMAEKIAARLHERFAVASDSEFVTGAFEMILGAPPTDDEVTSCLEALAQWRGLSAQQPMPEQVRRSRSRLVHALLNHNDFVTVR